MQPTITSSALDLIGHTPLVSLDRIHKGPGRILAKAEFMQPGGSVKDRAARAIIIAIIAAREDGRLGPGTPVVEMTSGNMGAGLAVVCATLGHPLVITMSAGNCPQRARMLEALGASSTAVVHAPTRTIGVLSRSTRPASGVRCQVLMDCSTIVDGIVGALTAERF